MRRFFLATVATVCFIPAFLAAQIPESRNAAPTIDDILTCRTLASESARLACFDDTAARLAKARDDHALGNADPATRPKSRRALFGMATPDVHPVARDTAEPEVKTIDATVVSVGTDRMGAYLLGLDDGSTWRLGEPPRGGDPARGERIHIRRGALGSYFGSVADRLSIRVQRLR